MQVISHDPIRLAAADKAGTRYLDFETLLREPDHLVLFRKIFRRENFLRLA